MRKYFMLCYIGLDPPLLQEEAMCKYGVIALEFDCC